MDRDPELDVTLSDGRRVATFQIAAVAGGREAWLIVEPGALRRVIRGDAAALRTRQRVDTRIAARLAAGWVPVDPTAPFGPPAPLPPDLALQISSLLEALARGRPALQAADPSGQLWAAGQVFRHQAWRFGVGVSGARVARARQERRLGELAEQAGNIPAAILHYRAALASHAKVGVTRRLARLVPPPTPPASARAPRARVSPPRGFAPASPPGPPADSTGLVAAHERSCVRGHPARPHTGRHAMTGRIQIVGRLPVALNRRVRAAAQRQQVSLNAFLIEALTQALGPRRIAPSKAAR
jgi:HicB family